MVHEELTRHVFQASDEQPNVCVYVLLCVYTTAYPCLYTLRVFDIPFRFVFLDF
jgi:hypothetical protein